VDGAAVISGERVVVRPVTLDDVDLLVRWHADPEVARFWDDKTYTREQMTARLARRQVAPYVVEAEGGPIGYLQTWVGDERGAAGIDMFLVSEARGRGLGPEAARLVAADLVSRGYERVTVDPYLWNEAAVRAWVRAGFRPVEARAADEEHTAPWLLMELEPLGD
jgi:aminoglycoside 6'-N-acetyltransferase